MSTIGPIAVLLLLLSPGFAMAQEHPWPMFRHDLKHTGHTRYTGPPTPTVAWTFPATDGIVSSPAVHADGTIYVGAGWYFLGATDHNLYALNPDGTLKWNYTAIDGFFSSPAIGPDGTIYLSGLDGHLYAIEDLETHAELSWRISVGYGFALSSPAVGPNGNVYVGSPDFHLYAVRPADGSVAWRWQSNWCIISSPAIGDDGIIYVGSKDHNLYAFDDALEAPIWQLPTGTFYDGHLVDSSPAIGADGTIYFGTDPYGAVGQDPIVVDTNFWAANPDGTLKWSFDTGDGVESSPAIGPDGTIYFGSYDQHLYAITDNGSEAVLKWAFPTNGQIDGSPTVDGDGVIYFGSRDSTLYALYPDGTVKWTFVANDGFECSPTIDDKGYLYIGSFDGNIYALGTGGPDVGVASVDVPAEIVVSTTHVPSATIRNYRAQEQQLDVTCSIDADGMNIYEDTVSVTIPGGEDRQPSFAAWQVGPDVDVLYTVTVTTTLAGDENGDNDQRTMETLSVPEPGPPGDCNGDGQVDLTDLGILLAAYGACTGDANYNPDADFDLSGCVDLTDLATLLGNYGFGT
jgi:outer membrane protein assembly factor BamB